MRILFVHQNFPAQFKHLAPALAQRGADVRAMCFNEPPSVSGVTIYRSQGTQGTTATHPWAIDLESKIIRGEATLRTAQALDRQGYRPDVIIAHPAWGESLFLKDLWPDARFGMFCELFYRANHADHDFDPEFARNETPEESRAKTRLKNWPQRTTFEVADAGLSPTFYQADTYPAAMRERITVVHDGIDTDRVAPGPRPPFNIDGHQLTDGDEVITFVSRHLEPYRGLHVLIRALPDLLRRRPRARVVIVGSDGVGYGARPDSGTWRQRFLVEVGDALDVSRVHFVGELAYPVFLNLLRASSLHIYLTYPFVLSWSMLEAMSSGCALLASDVAPVSEFVNDGVEGALVPFFDREALVERACALLDDAELRRHLGINARAKILKIADLKTICLPRQLAWVDALANGSPRVGFPEV